MHFVIDNSNRRSASGEHRRKTNGLAVSPSHSPFCRGIVLARLLALDALIDFLAMHRDFPRRVDADPHLIVEITDFGRVQDAVGYLETLGLAR